LFNTTPASLSSSSSTSSIYDETSTSDNYDETEHETEIVNSSLNQHLPIARKLLRRRHVTQEKAKKKKRKFAHVVQDSLMTLSNSNTNNNSNDCHSIDHSISSNSYSSNSNANSNTNGNDNGNSNHKSQPDTKIQEFFSTPHRNDVSNKRITRSTNNKTFYTLEFPIFKISPNKKKKC